MATPEDYMALFAPLPSEQEVLADQLRKRQRAVGQLGAMAGTPMGQRMGQALLGGQGDLTRQQAAQNQAENLRLQAERMRQSQPLVEARTETEGLRGDVLRKKLKGDGGKAAAARAAEKATKAKRQGFQDVMALRKEFSGLPEVKDFKAVDVSFRKIQTAAKTPTAAGDLSLIFGYMKMLDPRSTVREGEFANAQNAGGVDDKLMALYNNVRAGQRLTPSQRADFLNQSQGVYQSQRQAYDSAAKQYSDLASQYGIDPKDVVRAYEQPMQQKGGGSAPKAGMVRVKDKASGLDIELDEATAKMLKDLGEVE